jgi:hypothetical protein
MYWRFLFWNFKTVSRRHFWKFDELIWLSIYSIWPGTLFSVSGIRPDIRQAKSSIWPDTGYNKKAGLSDRISDASQIPIPCFFFVTVIRYWGAVVLWRNRFVSYANFSHVHNFLLSERDAFNLLDCDRNAIPKNEKSFNAKTYLCTLSPELQLLVRTVRNDLGRSISSDQSEWPIWFHPNLIGLGQSADRPY